MLNVRSVADLSRIVAANLHRLDRSKYDVVVGIPRSGMIPATMIATHLQLPLADCTGYAKGIIHGRSGLPAPCGKRVLLVDDSCNKGRAMRRAVSLLGSKAQVTRLAVFGPYQVDPSSVVDITFAECRGPRAFSWNMQKHIRLPRWGFDFDGVLCRDPTKIENDDGPRYEEFLHRAEPAFVPQRPIGHIVTGRLEKYRPHSEAWLRRRGIEWAAMTMMPYATKVERMAVGGRGQWKAGIVKQLGLEFFLESNPRQAHIISREAGIPVWCTETQELACPTIATQ